MRTKLTLFFCGLLLIFLIILSSHSEEQPVFMESNDQGYLSSEQQTLETFYLSKKEGTITEKELLLYSEDHLLTVVSLLPYYHPLYQKQILNSEFPVVENNVATTVTKIKRNYLEQLKQVNDKNGFADIQINGMRFKKIKVFATSHNIFLFLKKYPQLQFHS